jgi:hypothetical protein
MALTFERFTAGSVGVITLVDRFAQLRGTRGPFPPPIGEVRFLLLAQIINGVASAFDPPLRLRPTTSPGGLYLFPREAAMDAGPTISLPAGRYRLRIEGDFYQTIEQEIDFPPDTAQPPTFRLLPGPAYPFPDLTLKQNRLTLLRGSLFAMGEGNPVAAATVTITDPALATPFKSCVTGANGDWVVAFFADRATPPVALTLHFTLPDGSSFDVANVEVQPGAENSLPQTALRGRVLDTSGAPISRSIITVSDQPGQSLTRTDGQWFFYLSMLLGDTEAHVTARAPNGRTAEQDVHIRSRATVVVPAFQIAMN